MISWRKGSFFFIRLPHHPVQVDHGHVDPVFTDLVGVLLHQPFADASHPQERAENQQAQADTEQQTALALEIGLAESTFESAIAHGTRRVRKGIRNARILRSFPRTNHPIANTSEDGLARIPIATDDAAVLPSPSRGHPWKQHPNRSVTGTSLAGTERGRNESRSDLRAAVSVLQHVDGVDVGGPQHIVGRLQIAGGRADYVAEQGCVAAHQQDVVAELSPQLGDGSRRRAQNSGFETVGWRPWSGCERSGHV